MIEESENINNFSEKLKLSNLMNTAKPLPRHKFDKSGEFCKTCRIKSAENCRQCQKFAEALFSIENP